MIPRGWTYGPQTLWINFFFRKYITVKLDGTNFNMIHCIENYREFNFHINRPEHQVILERIVYAEYLEALSIKKTHT